MRILRRLSLLAVAAALAMIIVAGCGGDDEATTDATPTDGASDEPMAIAFFGFAKANSFAQATFAGIEEYAAANNATATFFDGAFDAPTQVSQIQDATTSGKYQVFIVQANDGTAVIPAVEQAIAAGITVVAEFTPVGTRYDTAEPQVEGMYFVGDIITENGEIIAQLGLDAAAAQGIDKPVIAYLQGFPDLPLDNARTKAAVSTLEAGGAEVIDTYVGGYTTDSGRAAGQDLFAAHPDVNVVIGSSQAIAGVETVIPEDLVGKVQLVGNGGSVQAVTAVKEGRWFGTYVYPETLAGAKAAEIGLGAARGEDMPNSVTVKVVAEENGIAVAGTAETVTDLEGFYND
jgi:ribose transport system substrate-binding protein